MVSASTRACSPASSPSIAIAAVGAYASAGPAEVRVRLGERDVGAHADRRVEQDGPRDELGVAVGELDDQAPAEAVADPRVRPVVAERLEHVGEVRLDAPRRLGGREAVPAQVVGDEAPARERGGERGKQLARAADAVEADRGGRRHPTRGRAASRAEQQPLVHAVAQAIRQPLDPGADVGVAADEVAGARPVSRERAFDDGCDGLDRCAVGASLGGDGSEGGRALGVEPTAVARGLREPVGVRGRSLSTSAS